VEASAIFGFAGVLVGAGSAYVAQRGAEGRRNKANTRVGVRLSHLDLIAMRSTLRNALNHNQVWIDNVAADLSASRWNEHNVVLAETLPIEDWMTVEHAIYLVRDLDAKVRQVASQSPDSFELTKRRREVIEEVMEDLDKASEVLTRWMYKTQPIWTRVRARTRERFGRSKVAV
jgi:uncharacterized protein YecE (DUF72 family)